MGVDLEVVAYFFDVYCTVDGEVRGANKEFQLTESITSVSDCLVDQSSLGERNPRCVEESTYLLPNLPYGHDEVKYFGHILQWK